MMLYNVELTLHEENEFGMFRMNKNSDVFILFKVNKICTYKYCNPIYP